MWEFGDVRMWEFVNLKMREFENEGFDKCFANLQTKAKQLIAISHSPITINR